jgi:uncharacterized protein YcgI (DUF1989 family)
MTEPRIIPPRSGIAFRLGKGETLTVIDPEGQQVADLVAFSAANVREAISSGRSLDYASKLYLTTGDAIYSNRSNVMLRIVEDKVGRHDFLLAPCSSDTFKIIYHDENPHRGCFGNLEAALAPFDISPDQIPIAFNCFMNVVIQPATGAFTVEPPRSRGGDFIKFRAEMDLVVGLTACSAPQSNNYAFKPIAYSVD